MDWIGLSIFVVYLITTGFVFFLYIKMREYNKKLIFDNAQLLLDKAELIKKFTEISNANASVEQTDGFLKFVSESRDWAFEYIEGIQKALKKYDEALSLDDVAKRNEAYIALLKFLPDDFIKN